MVPLVFSDWIGIFITLCVMLDIDTVGRWVSSVNVMLYTDSVAALLGHHCLHPMLPLLPVHFL